MAIEYDLILAGGTPVEQVAERAFPDLGERPTGVGLLAADLDERLGFDVAITAGKNAYIAVETDTGSWEWEPDTYVSMTFRLDKTADRDWAITNVLTAVRRVLDSGAEDAGLVLNSDVLLLARLDGVLVKHRRQWWDSHASADRLISD